MTHGTLPLTDYLTATPVLMSAGACLANDPRGIIEESTGRYIYAIFNTTNFWRYDTWADSWQQLTSPTGTGNVAFGAGVTMTVDPSRNLIYLFMPDTVANAWFRSYDWSNDTWSAALNVATLGLGAPWGTSGKLLHLCRMEAAVSDDSIYLVGNNATTIYQYSIANNTWTALLGAGGVRGAAPGAGVTLDWIASRSTDFLYSIRGAGTRNIDRYQISNDTWADVLYQPPEATTAPETFGVGTCAAPDTVTPGIAIYRDATMRLRELRFATTTTVRPELGTLGTFTGTDGVAHLGQALVTIRSADGTIWFYFAKHSQNTFMRLQRML